MFQNLEVLFRRLAYRRAFRAIHRAQGSSWYMRELLKRRLETGLSTPHEVLATIGSWKSLPEVQPEGLPVRHQ
jgi:hypothetical protein